MIESYLSTLYQIEELLQTSIASSITSDDIVPIEEALHLLNGIITDLELNALNMDSDLDDENYIPNEQ